MRIRYQAGWALALGLLLLSGCATTRSGSGQTRAYKEKPLTSRQGSAAPVLSDADLAKRAESAAHYATGIIYDLNEQPDRAVEEYWNAAIANPQYEPVVLELSRRLIRSKQSDRAIEILTKASKEKDASGTIFAWLGVAYAQAGKTDPAIAANYEAVKRSPTAVAPYQNLAQLYLQTSKTNQALKILDEAAHQPAATSEFLVDLAEVYARFGALQILKSGDLKTRVVALLDRAAAGPPKNPHTVQKLADGYMLSGEPGKAEKFYLQLLREFPELPNLHEKLADIYLRTGNKEGASKQLEEITKQNPTNPQPYLFLGSLALEQKKYDRAAEFLSNALLLNPDFEPVYYDLAGLKLMLKKPGEALELLEKARGKFKVSFALEFSTGMTKSMLKKYSEAIQSFTSAEVLAQGNTNRLNPQFFYQFGSAYERNGQFEEAEKQFQKAIRLDPDFAEALNYLGYMWAEHGVKLEEAREMIAKAIKLEPDNAAFLDSLGWVLFKLKKPGEALPYLQKAIEHSEEPDPTLYDHLGDVYAALGQDAAAKEAWQKSLHLENNDQVEQIKKKLESLSARERSAR